MDIGELKAQHLDGICEMLRQAVIEKINGGTDLKIGWQLAVYLELNGTVQFRPYYEYLYETKGNNHPDLPIEYREMFWKIKHEERERATAMRHELIRAEMKQL